MKTKFLIPVLAAIFAIGMSFTNVDSIEQAQDFIYLGNNSWDVIPEQNCKPGGETCQVQIGAGGPIYPVYDEMNLSTLKKSPTTKPIVINP